MSRRLDDVRLAVLMLDGIELKGGPTSSPWGSPPRGEDPARPLGGLDRERDRGDGAFADLVDRGLDTSQGVLVVLDGAKALARRSATCSASARRGSCIRHKGARRGRAPAHDRPQVKRRPRAAWKLADYRTALGRLRDLAAELERTHPGAAASLREGWRKTLTLRRLGVDGRLWRMLSSANPCESMIECIRRTQRNVKRWRDGEMALRWTAAGMLEAERQFRRMIGYRELGKLAVAVEREVNPAPPPSPIWKEVREAVTV